MLAEEKVISRHDRLLVFVVLDASLYHDTLLHVNTMIQAHPDLRFKIVDVSAYGQWIEHGTKRDLREVARGLQELCALLEAEAGVGQRKEFERERRSFVATAKHPLRRRLDVLNQPVRNRFLPGQSFLVDLNTATGVSDTENFAWVKERQNK